MYIAYDKNGFYVFNYENKEVFMKLLRLKVKGISLLKKELDISFYGLQRVSDEDKDSMYHLFSNIYLNCANAFIGKNASGKTTVLQVISLALNILNNEPVNHIPSKYVLSDEKKVDMFIYYFVENEGVYCLNTTISESMSRYKIIDEKLYFKSIRNIKSKKELTDFILDEPIQVRNQNEEFLSDDVSMIIARNKKSAFRMVVSNLQSFTSSNTISPKDEVSLEIIQFLDPTIESLYFDSESISPHIHLKFKGKKEIVLNSVSELELYLSSGTIKGILAFTQAKEVLKNGGYLLVDEIENHFNKEIVSTLIRLFMDNEFNKNGGILIYTTHYPELLDEYERNDSIYITENNDGITITNLSKLLLRNDIKKSDAYESGLIAQTAPEYESYMNMKKHISAYIIKG